MSIKKHRFHFHLKLSLGPILHLTCSNVAVSRPSYIRKFQACFVGTFQPCLPQCHPILKLIPTSASRSPRPPNKSSSTWGKFFGMKKWCWEVVPLKWSNMASFLFVAWAEKKLPLNKFVLPIFIHGIFFGFSMSSRSISQSQWPRRCNLWLAARAHWKRCRNFADPFAFRSKKLFLLTTPWAFPKKEQWGWWEIKATPLTVG